MNRNPRTFISFDYDNNENEKTLFSGQAKNSKTPFNIEDWSSKEPLLQSQWESIVRDKINRCNLMIVLVGNSMERATGVKKEIKMAIEQGIPFFGVYVNGANQYSILPAGLRENRTITWNWDKIEEAILQMMNEGKNKI